MMLTSSKEQVMIVAIGERMKHSPPNQPPTIVTVASKSRVVTILEWRLMIDILREGKIVEIEFSELQNISGKKFP
jgi:hypothetical protein